MQWENVHIFISSTFNDMHAERDYLVKSVFPALAEWCEERKLRFIDIDLRWGVTAADAEAKNTVQTCLHNIDTCRPFFLCLLGQRRGWVPSAEDIGTGTYESFPKLVEKQYVGRTSVTEMEILHALMDPLYHDNPLHPQRGTQREEAMEYAFFFLRDADYLDALPHPDLCTIYTNEAERDPAAADKELACWREQRIPQTGRPVFAYSASWQPRESTPEIALPLFVPSMAPSGSKAWQLAFQGWKKRWAAAGIVVDASGEMTGATLEKAKEYNKDLTNGRLGNFLVNGRSLATVMIEQLQAAIAIRFPAHMVVAEQTPLQKELDQQAQFLYLASESFIERPGDFHALHEYLKQEERRPFAVVSKAGLGKTSYLAHFINSYACAEGTTLHFRFVGGSHDSVNAKHLWFGIFQEWQMLGKIKNDVEPDDILTKMPRYLEEAGQQGKTILILDGLDQLDGGLLDFDWLPTSLPANVKLIVSFKLGSPITNEYFEQSQRKESLVFYQINPIAELRDRQMLVDAYLSRYLKALDDRWRDLIVQSNAASNPLFLKVVLSELRVYGSFQSLGDVIERRFGETPESAFQALLARLESDPMYAPLPGCDAVPLLFGMLAASRNGLSEDDLVYCFSKEFPHFSEEEIRQTLRCYVRQTQQFLLRRNDCIDFRYGSFAEAAQKRYAQASHKHNQLIEAVSNQYGFNILNGFIFGEKNIEKAVKVIHNYNTLVEIGINAGRRDCKLPDHARDTIRRLVEWELKFRETEKETKQRIKWISLKLEIGKELGHDAADFEIQTIQALLKDKVPTEDDYPSISSWLMAQDHDEPQRREERIKSQLHSLKLEASIQYVEEYAHPSVSRLCITG